MIKELEVKQPSRKKGAALEVKVMFEPSRVALTSVMQAYERIVPVVKRTGKPRLDEAGSAGPVKLERRGGSK